MSLSSQFREIVAGKSSEAHQHFLKNQDLFWTNSMIYASREGADPPKKHQYPIINTIFNAWYRDKYYSGSNMGNVCIVYHNEYVLRWVRYLMSAVLQMRTNAGQNLAGFEPTHFFARHILSAMKANSGAFPPSFAAMIHGMPYAKRMGSWEMSLLSSLSAKNNMFVFATEHPSTWTVLADSKGTVVDLLDETTDTFDIVSEREALL